MAKVSTELVRKTEITIPYKYTPRVYQTPVFTALDEGIRRIGCVWHRRAGKDRTCWNALIREAWKQVGTYFYVFPLLNQARKAVWQARGKDGVRFLDHIPEQLRAADPKEVEMLIQLANGSNIQLLGSDNAAAYRGTNPLGVVFSEFAFSDPAVWDTFRPILAENGGFAIFNSTPCGKNHYYDLYHKTEKNPRWRWTILTVNDTFREDGITPVVTQEMIEEDRLSGMEEEFLNQEYFCSFTGTRVGSYYGKLVEQAEAEGRIGLNINYDPLLPVFTAWDIGTRDATTIWFYQKKGRAIYFIDYYEDSGEGIEYYIKHLYKLPYTYAKNYAPHDIKKRDFSSGKNALDVAASLTGKFNFFEVVPKLKIEDGIQAVRSLFPRSHFNSIKCKRGLEALKDYHKKWDQDKRIFAAVPAHTWSSHGADSFRVFATSYEEPVAVLAEEPVQRRPSGMLRSTQTAGWMQN